MPPMMYFEEDCQLGFANENQMINRRDPLLDGVGVPALHNMPLG